MKTVGGKVNFSLPDRLRFAIITKVFPNLLMNGERPMKKKAILAMLLAMCLLLSGCALIKKDAAVDAKRVILSYNGTDVTKAEIGRAHV